MASDEEHIEEEMVVAEGDIWVDRILAAMEATVNTSPDNWIKDAAATKLISELSFQDKTCVVRDEKKLALVRYSREDIIKTVHPFVETWTQRTHYELDRWFVYYSKPFTRGARHDCQGNKPEVRTFISKCFDFLLLRNGIEEEIKHSRAKTMAED